MDKNAIKKYAVWARTELIDRVHQRVVRYEITADANPNEDSASGKVLTPIEKTQRQAAIARMRDKGYEYVIEEVAYTWFNRFAALRYMEVNNHLPSRVRVFTDENGSFKPQILAEAIHLNLDGLDMEKVYALKEAENNDELYKYLLITQCNALSAVLPQMFKPVDEKCKQEKDDYTILLFPDNLLREGSVVEQMVTLISEDNWLDAVQIIGWLYQYYNSEPKDKVFADLKKNIKIMKENIPAATQLFTPDWIVRYMVENSLGRLWLEGHPQNTEELLPTEAEQVLYIAGDRNSEDSKWHYYLKEAEQEPDVQKQLAEIRKEYSALKPEDILCIDPCMGSGHIIVYMFDALMKIYAAYGYSTRESVQSIIENNLYGLDIDDRAAQLAYFAVMMKAVQYDNRFLKRSEISQPHVYAIKESNHLDSYAVEYFCNGDKKLTVAMHTLIEEMHDATEYGSILNITQVDFSALYARFNEIKVDISIYREVALNELLPFVQVAEVMSQRYDVVVTNPPYMAISNATAKMNEYTKKHYNDGKADLFAVFMEKCRSILNGNGIQAMITQQSWMFLASFETLRKSIIGQNIINMAHLGSRAFEEIGGEVVQTTTFVLRKVRCKKYRSTYCRLLDFAGQDVKEKAFLSGENILIKEQDAFDVIPGSPVAYWIDKSISNAYVHPLLATIAFSDGQILTGNNNKYLRLIWEVSAAKISPESDWVLHAKGGEYRRWYGNIDTIVSWSQQSRNHYRKDKIARFPKEEILFRRGITWTLVSMNPNFGVRELSSDLTFNKAAATILFDDERKINYVIGLLNSKVAQELLKVINPTMNNNIKDILNMPYIYSETYYTDVCQLVVDNIALSKADWDSYETSWGFGCNPLTSAIVQPQRLKNIYSEWVKMCDERFLRMKSNEERLNKIFLEIYGMSEAFDYSVEDCTVTVRKADLHREIKGLISFAVGCMFGRYSLDKDGLAYAGGEWNAAQYKTFPADKDNIIPICDDEYFDDDITGLFVKFIETVYGKNTLNENLKFIADALGSKGTPKEVIRHYFLNDFFTDHCKMYQKRPIYWLFDSGKKNGFKALVYMHRYQPDTIARMRTDYVHEQQSRYRTAIADLKNRIAGASTSERVRLTKQLSKLQDQSAEIHTYEEKIHHLADRMIAIDLDDGVKHNYEIFKDVLAKIK